jgi:ribosomal protein L36
LRRRSGSGAFRHSRTSIPESTTARRKGRIYIINKTQKRYKARQG